MPYPLLFSATLYSRWSNIWSKVYDGMSTCPLNPRRLHLFHQASCLWKFSSSCKLFLQSITLSSSWKNMYYPKSSVKMCYETVFSTEEQRDELGIKCGSRHKLTLTQLCPALTNTLLITMWCFQFACSCTVWKDVKPAWQPDVQKINWS